MDDLSPLWKCKNWLKSLTMFNLRASHCEDIVNILCELVHLRHLDISEGNWGQNFFFNIEPIHLNAADLLQRTRSLPALMSLDLSGKEGVSEDLLMLVPHLYHYIHCYLNIHFSRPFIRSHPQMHFLGLATIDACHLPDFADPTHPKFLHNFTVSPVIPYT